MADPNQDQTLGLDASSFFREQEKVNRALEAQIQKLSETSKAFDAASAASEGYTSKLRSVSDMVTGSVSKIVSAFPSLSNVPVKSVKELTGALDDLDKQQYRTREGLLLSWTTMGRVLSIQLLHTLIRSFVQELRESIKTTEEFQIRISEIRTISQDTTLTFNDWANSVRRLSDEFGNPILEVAEGTYQTISNQIAKGADAANFMSRAMEFSRATISTTDQSVNLLSSALNSFRLSTGDTERVAASFFKTIEIGRLRAQDISDIFGRSGPLARQLGVSLDEVNAAIATLTINGVPAHESLVLINGVMNALIRPSKDMKQALHDIGVESGQQAIQMYGLAGVLQKLDEVTHGASDELAQLFRNVRAERGGISLSGISGEDFRRNLEQIRNAGAEYQKAIQITLESPAKQLEIQMERIRNYVRFDWGQTFIQTVVSVSNSLSDQGLLGVFKELISVGTTGLEIFASYKLANLGIAAASTITSRNEQIQATVTAINTNNQRLNTIAIAERTAAEAALAKAIDYTTIGEIKEAEAASVTAAAHARNAEAALAAAEAQGVATKSTVALGGALEGLGAIISSPAFLLTTLIFSIGYAIQEEHRLSEEIAHAAENAHKVWEESTSKQVRLIEESLAEENRITREALDIRFLEYLGYTQKIIDLAEQNTENVKNNLEDQIELTKRSISDYVKVWNEGSREIEQNQKKALDNIRKAEEDLNTSREDFARQEFKRSLEIAQHLDALATPGKGKLFDENQLNLILSELQRIEQARAALLATPATDSKQAGQNLQDAQKSLRDENNLLNDVFTRRLHLEEERKRVAEELAKAQEKISGDQAANAAKNTNRQLEEQEKNLRNIGTAHRNIDPRILNIGSQRQGVEDAESKRRQAEQQANDQKNLDLLKQRLSALDNSLALLPKQNELEQKFTGIQSQNNDLLQQYINLQKQAADEAARELANRNLSFERIRASLDEISKFKTEKPEIRTKEDLDKQLDSYTLLINKALQAGVTDQNVIANMYNERATIAEAGNARLLEIQAKADAAQLQQQKDFLEKSVQQQEKATEDAAKNLVSKFDAAKQIIGQLSIPEKGTVQIDEGIEKLNRALDLLQRQAINVGKTGQPIDPKAIQEYVNALNELRRSEQFNPHINQDEVLKQIGALQGLPNTLQTAQQQLLQQRQQFESQRQALAITNQQINATRDTVKSFSTLNDEILKTVDALKQLENILPHPVPTEHKALGGFMNGPRGTDTIPAYLSPGEYVINAAATSRFLPQLEAINRYYADGGFVGDIASSVSGMENNSDLSITSGNTYNNFGDIHATVQSSGNERIDARKLVTELQREIRRTGASLLGNQRD